MPTLPVQDAATILPFTWFLEGASRLNAPNAP